MDSPYLFSCLDDFDTDATTAPFSNLLAHSASWPQELQAPCSKRTRDGAFVLDEGQKGTSAGSTPAKCAKSKASREKARRERINERFAELARLCDGEDPKVDKSSILLDAIKNIKRQRMESQQLKELNKFLQDRVTQYEKERNDIFNHQNLFLQPSTRAEASVSGIPTYGRYPYPSSAQKIADSVISDHPGVITAGTGTAMGIAVGVPVGDQKFSALQGNEHVRDTAAGWTQESILDTSHDHLLRPPAA